MGRGEALELAAQGAKVVVNDYGGTLEGRGGDKGPADETVDDHQATAAARPSPTTATSPLERLRGSRAARHRRLRRARHRREQRRHPARRVDRQDDRARLRLRDPRAPQGHVQHDAPRLRRTGRTSRRPAASARRPSSTRCRRPGLQGNQGQANYGAAKAGIAALTVITALEGKRYGVRANAIAPGGATRMVNEAMPSIPIVEADRGARRRLRAAQPRATPHRWSCGWRPTRRCTCRVRCSAPSATRSPTTRLELRATGQGRQGHREVGSGQDRRRGGAEHLRLQPGGLQMGALDCNPGAPAAMTTRRRHRPVATACGRAGAEEAPVDQPRPGCRPVGVVERRGHAIVTK